jgi:hypothetical protein
MPAIVLGRRVHAQHATQQHGQRLEKTGTPGEVAEATRRLVQVLDVVAVSGPYPDRGASRLVRVYEVRLHHPASDQDQRKVGG